MKDATDITVILDRSGSMVSIAADTIGGFNRFVAEQKAVPGECRFTFIQFDTQNAQEVVCDAVPVHEVKDLTATTFQPRAGTPLYDAVGRAIVRAGERLSALTEDSRPDKVVFVIITDGEENSSAEYTRERVFDMIRHQSEAYKWEFVYLGANQDAMQTGMSIGTKAAAAATYTAFTVSDAYAAASSNLAAYRNGAVVSTGFTDEQKQRLARKSAS